MSCCAKKNRISKWQCFSMRTMKMMTNHRTFEFLLIFRHHNPRVAGLAHNASRYNRANYLFDAGLRFSRYTSGQRFHHVGSWSENPNCPATVPWVQRALKLACHISHFNTSTSFLCSLIKSVAEIPNSLFEMAGLVNSCSFWPSFAW